MFGDEGYRPVSKAVLDTFDFPTPASLFTIADLGGWKNVQTEFFDRESGYMAEVQQELGQPTEVAAQSERELGAGCGGSGQETNCRAREPVAELERLAADAEARGGREQRQRRDDRAERGARGLPAGEIGARSPH